MSLTNSNAMKSSRTCYLISTSSSPPPSSKKLRLSSKRSQNLFHAFTADFLVAVVVSAELRSPALTKESVIADARDPEARTLVLEFPANQLHETIHQQLHYRHQQCAMPILLYYYAGKTMKRQNDLNISNF